MIDEMAREITDVFEIAKLKCADMINIHSNWAGGFQAAIQKANLAEAAGIGTMVGGVTFQGISNAAYKTLASVIPGDYPCEQRNAEFDCLAEPLVEKEYVTIDGRSCIPDQPGLGIKVIYERLEAASLETVEIQ
jgi:L-alanine-DL-glutamate epimerase-like enolase superfamily enzyme